MPASKVLIYVLRRDLRVSDNPVLHFLSAQKDHGFTHLLPLYVFAAQQVDVSGFMPENASAKSPYPEARSAVGGFWRCGPYRAKFLSESVWDLKRNLEKMGSGLCIRVGMVGEVIKGMVVAFDKGQDMKVGGVWMTSEEGVEEKREERSVKTACEEAGIQYQLWGDEKYLIDDRDLPFNNTQELPDVYTTYRKMVEPLRSIPRPVLSTPAKGSLPPFPADVPAQHSPFAIPTTYESLEEALLKPLTRPGHQLVKNPPSYPPNSQSAHPFHGGESSALERLDYLMTSGCITNYKETRNGLLGADFSSKLSAYLALGSITARQIHASMLNFEDGTLSQTTNTSPSGEEETLSYPIATSTSKWDNVPGYGKGENEGTKAMRFELLWRDYMRLCTRKFGPRLFHLSGFRDDDSSAAKWISPSNPTPDASSEHSPEAVTEMIERFLNGTTGMGLIDASQRELIHTGYTSNRARQNVASFLAKHLYVDWRIGAEWYECMLVDYDVSSNWGNWQYLAGTGNDPRGEKRIFNPVKQAFEYDPNAEYVKTWVQELRDLSDPGEVFQAWTVKDEQRRAELGLAGLVWVERPLKRIEFTVGRRGHSGRGRGGGRGRRGGGGDGGGGNRNRGGESVMGRGSGQSRGGYGGRGYGNSRGHLREYARAQYSGPGGGGREARTGMMDKDRVEREDGGEAS